MNPQLALGTMVPLVAAGAVALVRMWARTEQSARDITYLRDDIDLLTRDLREWREHQIRFEERLAGFVGHDKS